MTDFANMLKFARGEDILLAIDLTEGDPAWVDDIAADLRRLGEGTRSLLPSQPVAGTFTLTSRAAAGAVPAGWDARIPGVDTVGLTAGFYLTDTRIETVDGKVLIGEPVTIQITEPATVRD